MQERVPAAADADTKPKNYKLKKSRGYKPPAFFVISSENTTCGQDNVQHLINIRKRRPKWAAFSASFHTVITPQGHNP